jgi:serine/arginine repetitive matrix protein 2
MAQMNSMNPMMTGMSQMSGFQAPLNPMMTGMSQMSGWGMPTGMMNPQQFMPMQPPSNADPAFLAAHQQAMHIAKQAYQMAVAQQAMAAAADEWERQSNAGGSVYGFPSSASSVGGFGGNPMMGMGGWGGGMMFSSARSAYGGSVYAGSEAGWGGTRSVYGETFGPDPRGSMYSQAGDRRSRVPPVPSSTSGQGRSGQAFPQSDTGHLNVPGQPSRPRPRTKSSPGGRSGDGSSPSRTPPPSSWTRRYETALRD